MSSFVRAPPAREPQCWQGWSHLRVSSQTTCTGRGASASSSRGERTGTPVGKPAAASDDTRSLKAIRGRLRRRPRPAAGAPTAALTARAAAEAPEAADSFAARLSTGPAVAAAGPAPCVAAAARRAGWVVRVRRPVGGASVIVVRAGADGHERDEAEDLGARRYRSRIQARGTAVRTQDLARQRMPPARRAGEQPAARHLAMRRRRVDTVNPVEPRLAGWVGRGRTEAWLPFPPARGTRAWHQCRRLELHVGRARRGGARYEASPRLMPYARIFLWRFVRSTPSTMAAREMFHSRLASTSTM